MQPTLIDGQGRSIETVEHAGLMATVVREGAVILRGFSGDAKAVAAWSNALFERPGVWGGRQTHPEASELYWVNSGTHPLTLHCEMSYWPLRPDLVMFWCEEIACEGGATTLCDGRWLWDELPTPIRDFFLARRVRFYWLTGGKALPQAFPNQDANEILAALRSFPGNTATFADDGSLQGEFTTPVMFPGADQPALAFASSVIAWGPREPGFRRYVVLDDGEQIGADLRAELARCAEACTYAHAWQPGDLVLLDNWRYLHGRELFTGHRRVLTRHGSNIALTRTGG